eukprot:Pgem_evm1s866
MVRSIFLLDFGNTTKLFDSVWEKNNFSCGEQTGKSVNLARSRESLIEAMRTATLLCSKNG